MKAAFSAPAFAHFIEDWHLSPVLDTGDFVFLSGGTGAHPDLSVNPDPETQIRDTFEFLKDHLAVLNLTFDDVVEMTTYHVDLRKHLSIFTKVKDEYIGAPYPAWTAIGVSELITEGTIIEIRLVARKR
ncbi:MAG TPA: RidA family protein [Dongiaceae bacterium]|jgi:enamine deaminase RidA (YjgF/YER057c/UK114 family)